MKKILTIFSFFVLIITVITFLAFTPQQKDKKNKKEQQQGQDKKKGKPNQPGNAEAGRNNDKGKHDDKGIKSKNDNNGNNGKDDNKGNNGNRDREYNYSWNRETFKDRGKIKNQDKVTICHKFRSNDAPVTLSVSSNALQAHLSHGDVRGTCPAIHDNRYSDIFWRKRNDYYNYLQNTQEKVWYSRSILDYARRRLADSRLQLVSFQNRRMPPADLERKRVIVVQLEQHVTLLEALIGVTANLVVNKLQ